MDELRLRVTGREPVFPDRMVRETRVGAAVVAKDEAVTASLEGCLMTDHFSREPSGDTAAMVLP